MIFYALSESQDDDDFPREELTTWWECWMKFWLWLDPNFWGRNKLYFLDSAAVLTSRNTDIWLSCCVKARSPTEFGMIWSVLTASIPVNACTLLASVQLQKLNHGPHRTELYEIWETHNTWVLKPDSPFLPFIKAFQNDVLSTKVNRTLCYDFLWLVGYGKCGHGISVSQECAHTFHLSPSWHRGLQDVNPHVLFYKFYSQDRPMQQALPMCSPCGLKTREIDCWLITHKTISI